MIRRVQITVNECECDICHRKWLSFKPKPPQFCPNPECRSREWNGKKKPSHVHEIKFPAPRKPGRKRTITAVDIREGDE